MTTLTTFHDRASDLAKTLLSDKKTIDTPMGKKSEQGLTNMILASFPVELLERIESFLTGFNDDTAQEGITELLSDVRRTINEITQ